jgi:hypothetical protein
VFTRVLPGVVDEAAGALGRAVALAVAGVAVGGDGANEADDALQPATKTTVLSRTMTVRWFLPRIAYLSWDLWTRWFRRLNGLPCDHRASRGRLVRR